MIVFENPKALLGHLAMLTFSLLVSVSFTLGSIVANDIDPVVITSVRFVIAAMFILVIFVVSRNTSLSDLKNPQRFLILGGMISIYFVTMFEGLKTAEPISMSVVFTFTPLMAGVFDFLISKRRLSVWAWLSVILGGLGALYIIFDGNLNRFLRLQIGYGEGLFFIGCACHALYAASIPKLNRGEAPLSQTFGTLVGATLILNVIGFNRMVATDWYSLNSIVFLTFLYLAIFATSATFFLIQFAAIRLSSLKVMAYTYAVPFWVTLLQAILEKAAITMDLLVGGTAIFLSLSLLLVNKEF